MTNRQRLEHDLVHWDIPVWAFEFVTELLENYDRLIGGLVDRFPDHDHDSDPSVFLVEIDCLKAAWRQIGDIAEQISRSEAHAVEVADGLDEENKRLRERLEILECHDEDTRRGWPDPMKTYKPWGKGRIIVPSRCKEEDVTAHLGKAAFDYPGSEVDG